MWKNSSASHWLGFILCWWKVMRQPDATVAEDSNTIVLVKIFPKLTFFFLVAWKPFVFFRGLLALRQHCNRRCPWSLLSTLLYSVLHYIVGNHVSNVIQIINPTFPRSDIHLFRLYSCCLYVHNTSQAILSYKYLRRIFQYYSFTNNTTNCVIILVINHSPECRIVTSK